MVRASALYIVIVIALVIATICSSLIVVAYFYKLQYQKKFRQEQLQNNISSAINILLAGSDTSYNQEKTLDLFDTGADSVSLKKLQWGLYDIGVAKAFIQKNTVYKVFSFANKIDSTKWAALYLTDKDRPVSLSGKTTIKGDAYIPKAGVQEAYIDNKAYEGDKRLIIGTKHNSERNLPVLNEARLKQVEQLAVHPSTKDTSLNGKDSVINSYLYDTRFFDLKKNVQTIKDIKIRGNIIIHSDTTVIIDSTAALQNIIIYARSIIVNEGFHGNCQLFAQDSISIGKNCRFNYPSCAGIIRYDAVSSHGNEKITLGEQSVFKGIIFTYEKSENATSLPRISLYKKSKVMGQVYSQEVLELNDNCEIDGSVFTSTFLYKNSITTFENYLINITINSKLLSPYYLSSELTPVSISKKRILQWLEAN